MLRDEEMEVCYIYTYEGSIMKPTKHCLKEGRKRERGNGNVMEGMNCMHIWNYHNEFPHITNVG
jgi:hypothetical protein